ncbi:DUF481 domain-containing protein [Bremerella cremea]|uniref:DUF481 domain-containing protein n=1 Tax=Bremerella cremea TaxID=1031537 RepID=UPI0011C03ABF|nr:DUF481 domain-containing protein [Bremerella cremea]
MFHEIGRSYFESPITDVNEAEFVHYLDPKEDLSSSLSDIMQLPPLPELPAPKKPEAAAEEKPAEAPAAEKPAEATPEEAKPAEEVAAPEKKEPEEKPIEEIEDLVEEHSYGYLDYIPYGQYYHIDYWFGEATWKNSAELGFNGQTGNTISNSLRVGAKVRREGKRTIFTSEFKHLRTSDAENLTQNNAFYKHRLEWPLKLHERWALHENTNLEYDEFKAFDLRLVFNGGLSYKPYKTDRTDWTLSAGSGFSQEFGSPQKGVIPEASFGSDFTHNLTDRQSITFNLDFYPAFEANEGYRFTNEASYTIALDHGLSLKMSAYDRYDSTPNNRKRNDLDYACLLLWEF